MSSNFISLTAASHQLIHNSFPENGILKALNDETMQLFPERAHIRISADQAQFMKLLVKMVNAKNILEIGCFTGYSALAMAEELPEEGRLITCDVSETYTNLAKKYWEKANVLCKIDLRLAPAYLTLQTLIQNKEQFDIIFIDANEDQYIDYFNSALALSHVGSIILVDNVLALNGLLHTEVQNDPRAETMLKFNQTVRECEQVDSVILPVGGGMLLSRKRGF